MATVKPLGEVPKDLQSSLVLEKTLTLPHFTSEDAWMLGTLLRTRIRHLQPSKPAAINITLTNSDTLLFHATTCPGVVPDNDDWIARKRATVKRFGMSSWAVGRKFDGDGEMFRDMFMLGERAGMFAIHGGGVPVRVEGVEGVVAVVVVSGLRQSEDHMVVVEGLGELKEMMKGGRGGVDEGVGTDADVGVGVESDEVEAENKAVASTREARVMVEEQKADGAVLAS